MSVRFFRIFTGVFLVHLVVLNLVWVGFSAPNPRAPATFIYQGALPLQDAGGGTEDVWQEGKISDQFAFDPHEASYFNHWIEIRGPSKPVNHL